MKKIEFVKTDNGIEIKDNGNVEPVVMVNAFINHLVINSIVKITFDTLQNDSSIVEEAEKFIQQLIEESNQVIKNKEVFVDNLEGVIVTIDDKITFTKNNEPVTLDNKTVLWFLFSLIISAYTTLGKDDEKDKLQKELESVLGVIVKGVNTKIFGKEQKGEKQDGEEK